MTRSRWVSGFIASMLLVGAFAVADAGTNI
jgi:hypothetical protein